MAVAAAETSEIGLHQSFTEATGFDRQQIEHQAHYLIENRADLPNPEANQSEYRDNARTLLMEALTASGHESVVEIQEQTVADINEIILARLLNGWDDSLPEQEKERRFAELCNELVIGQTHQDIADGLLPENTVVGEISDYPSNLDDTVATSLGYRTKNKKGMIRSTALRINEDGTYTRIIQQISRSNGTAQSTSKFFQTQGIELAGGDPDVEALSTPIVYSLHDYPYGATDITRILDELSGPGVLYGDEGKDIQKHPDYQQLGEISKQREDAVECYFDGLAGLQLQLNSMLKVGAIDDTEHKNIFSEEIDRILSAICVLSPEYAEDTFGETAAIYFYRASNLTATGYVEAAARELERANLAKETITFCGGSITVKQARELGLKVNETGDLIKTGKENWKKKIIECRIENCPTRPNKTECGPCGVCMQECQPIFDKGDTPIWINHGTNTAKGVVSFAIKMSDRSLKLGPLNLT